MTDLTLRIEYAGGGIDELNIVSADDLGDATAPSLTSIRIERRIDRPPDEPDTAECAVYRDAWSEIEDSLGDVDDTLFIDENGTDIFGGRLRDWEYRGALVNVILDGPKRDAINETPSAGNTVYQPKSDDSLVTNDLLPRVGTVGEGTITQQTASIAFSEANSSPGKSITKLAQATGAEVLYTADFTLDYVASLGANKTGTTLSPSNGTVLGEPRIQHDPAEDYTHIRVLGSQQGGAQFVADRTIDGSTTRENWGFYTDKDAQTQDRVDAIADQIQSELQTNSDHLEIEVGIDDAVGPELGDEFTLDFPAYGIDSEPLRILQLTRILDSDGERYSALFSNRRLARDVRGEQQRRAFDEFRGGNPGQYYALTHGEGWDKVESGEDYEMSFYRPQDTLTEYRAKLQIESRPYRLSSSDPGHAHGVVVTHPSHSHGVIVTHPNHSHTTYFNITSDDNSELSNVVSSGSVLEGDFALNGSWHDITDVGPTATANSSWSIFHVAGLFKPDSSATTDFGVQARLEDENGDYYPDSTGQFHWVSQSDREVVTFIFVIARDVAPESITLQMRTNQSWGGIVTINHAHQSVGAHDHVVSSTETSDAALGTTTSETSTTELGTTTSETSTTEAALEPGVNEQSGETVSNASVDIDGTTVASGLSSPIDETVDIAGEFSDGANSITARTDTLGELKLTIEYEALKNAE